MNSVRIYLNKARKEYKSRNYEDSLKIFNKLHDEYSDEFKINDLITYSWAIYQVHVKDFLDENNLFEAVEFITGLIQQGDLNQANTCPYIFSVFKVMDYLYYEKDYFDLEEWLSKLDPLLLDEKASGNHYLSRREKYYSYASKTYLECGEFEKCIEISKDALINLTSFTNDNETWFKWRIAKSLRQLNQYQEALNYLKEVFKVRRDWYVKKEFAENYIALGNMDKSLKYLGDAVLTNDPASKKVNVYYLIYQILNESQPYIAFKHVELYYLLKSEKYAFIPDEVKDLDIDDDLDKNEIDDEIRRYWYDKIYNRKLEYGTVCELLDDDSGFIISHNLESVYFNKDDFDGEYIKEGMYVSFLTERSFEESLNKEVIKAVDIKEE